jgi:hypothetical protein
MGGCGSQLLAAKAVLYHTDYRDRRKEERGGKLGLPWHGTDCICERITADDGLASSVVISSKDSIHKRGAFYRLKDCIRRTDQINLLETSAASDRVVSSPEHALLVRARGDQTGKISLVLGQISE